MSKESQAKIEALLFAWGEQITYTKLARILNISVIDLKTTIDEMNQAYQREERGIEIIEIKQSVQLASKAKYGELIFDSLKQEKNRGLSRNLLEVLAIIAYKQPLTKAEIEIIRGVRSDRSVQQLVEIGFVEVCGQLEKIGRPNLYATTDYFLKKFGLTKLSELPAIESFERLQLSLLDEE